MAGLACAFKTGDRGLQERFLLRLSVVRQRNSQQDWRESMGLFSHEKWDLLEKCNLTQLRKMAKEKKVKVESTGFFRSKIIKEDYVQCLNDSNKISKAYIKESSQRRGGWCGF